MIEDEFEEYFREVEPKLYRYVIDGRKLYDEILSKLHELYIFTSFLIDKEKIANRDAHPSLMLLYIKLSLSLHGIYRCLRNGIITEAVILVRGLFEVLLNIELITNGDLRQNSKLFEDFIFLAQNKKIVDKKEELRNGTINQKDYDEYFESVNVIEIESNFEKVKNNYHPKNPKHWAWKLLKNECKGRNPSIYHICKKFGYGDIYKMLYSPFSQMVHGTSLISNIMAENNSITPTPIFSNLTNNLGYISLDLSTQGLKIIIEILNNGLSDELSKSFIVFEQSIPK